MKILYDRLSKEEKKRAKEEFSKTDENKDFSKRIKRLYIMLIVGIIYSIVSFGLDFYFDTLSIFDYILDGLLLVFCTILIVCVQDLHKKQINKYLVNKNKKKNK